MYMLCWELDRKSGLPGIVGEDGAEKAEVSEIIDPFVEVVRLESMLVGCGADWKALLRLDCVLVPFDRKHQENKLRHVEAESSPSPSLEIQHC